MKSLFTLLTLSLLTLIFVSCSDDAVNPEDGTDLLLPLKTGTYWIFEQYSLDSLNNRTQSTPEIIDSIAITGTAVKLDKMASVFSTFRKLGQPAEVPNQFYYTENQKIYTHSDFINNMINFSSLPVDLPIKIEEQWLLMIDPNVETWDIYQRTFSNDTVDFQGMATLVLNGTMTIKGKKAGTETLKVDGKDHKAHKYTLTISADLNVKVSIPGNPITIDDKIKFTRNFHLWFINKGGNVKQYLETLNLKIPFVGNQVINGYEATAVRYHVVE